MKGAEAHAGSSFNRAATATLVTARPLMRRIRDKVPCSTGDKRMLSGQGAGWMVSGSPPRLTRNDSDLVGAYDVGIICFTNRE